MVDAMARPELIRLEEKLFCAKFACVKVLPARHMLDCARRAGRIGPGSLIVETTSGTFALGLALVCKLEGYRLVIVSDPAIDDFLRLRLEHLGVELIHVEQPAREGGFQRARLERLDELRTRHPEAYWPCQYHNPENPAAFRALGALLIQELGSVDCLVGAVGSGGTMCGTSTYLRGVTPRLHAIGIDSYGSVLFGQPDRPRLLRGTGSSLLFKNLDHSAFDEVHWVTAAEAFAAAHRLYREKALFMGGTSGAAYHVARWWARRNPGAIVVAIFPDEGYRYLQTFWQESWLRQNGVWLDRLPVEPCTVKHPADAGPMWTRLAWERRSYEQVLGRAPAYEGVE
jgi:cysteine synthase A